jgi:CheY-like chemotaxis protein
MLTGNKILIVDDDELTREVLSSYFENEGYDVLCAVPLNKLKNYYLLAA